MKYAEPNHIIPYVATFRVAGYAINNYVRTACINTGCPRPPGHKILRYQSPVITPSMLRLIRLYLQDGPWGLKSQEIIYYVWFTYVSTSLKVHYLYCVWELHPFSSLLSPTLLYVSLSIYFLLIFLYSPLFHFAPMLPQTQFTTPSLQVFFRAKTETLWEEFLSSEV